MPRVRMVVGYDGTDFSGSQAQPGRRTVQGELERAVRQVAPGTGSLVFAGRTDRGVHAIGQVVSGDVDWCEGPNDLRTAINAVMPRDLVVSRVELVSPRFHARYDAIRREYRYRIHISPAPPVLNRRYVWWRRRQLDAERASAACARLTGRRNVATFAGLGRSRSLEPDQLEREIYACTWHEVSVDSRESPSASTEAHHEMRIVADGFLPQMVRNIAAAIHSVAEGKRPEEWISELLDARDRSALGEAAPPEGLTLYRVSYADDLQRPDAFGAQTGNEG